MKMDIALTEAHEAETALAAELLRVGERHRTDHDVHHLSRTFTTWCDEHVRALADAAARYDLSLEGDAVAEERDRGLAARVREKSAELVGHRPEPGVLLLRDIRELHVAAARTSLAWTLLGQGAQAVRDPDLLTTVTTCHPEAIRTQKWTVQKLKEAGPQRLTS